MSAIPPFRLGHRPALDGLRGVAILLVMAHHCNLPLLGFGYVGVDIFFVLSGFLITSLLVEEWRSTQAINLPSFYARRALRLLPALVLLLAVLSPFLRPSYILATLFYVSNWMMALDILPGMATGPLGIVWSLSVEEQFYLLWPALLSVLLHRRLRPAPLLAVSGILTLALSVWQLSHIGVLSQRRMYFGSDTHGAGLLMGCVLAIALSYGIISLQKRRQVQGVSFIALTVATVLLALSLSRHDSPEVLGLYSIPAFSLMAVAVILLTLSGMTSLLRFLSLSPLVAAGRISYGLYLFHYPILYFVRSLPMHPLAIAALVFVLSFLTAGLSYRLIEQPILRLKARLQPRTVIVSGAPVQRD